MDLDLSKIKNIHFIGIGGIGISAVARMMIGEGKIVTGQDIQDGEVIRDLRTLGINISIGQSYEVIPKDADLIVYTIAIESYDPDLFKKLKDRHDIFVKSYPEMLNVVTKDKYTIAISGTHGKTTTTGMIAQIFKDNQKNFNCIIGSLVKDENGNKSNFLSSPKQGFGLDRNEYFIVEACEYKRSFLNINPKILVITNIDNDHLDYYKDMEDIKSAFIELAMKVPKDGFVVCDSSDEYVRDVIKNINATVVDYQEFFNPDLKLKIPGIHNKKDAACAQAVSDILKINKKDAKKSLENFSGTWRRFEYKGKLKNGTMIYDDYAHHPSEIKATLQGFRELYPKSDNWHIILVFQPHLFSRTKLLLHDFAGSFRDTDSVLLLPIYFAREVDDGSISSQILSKEINKVTNNAQDFTDFQSAIDYLDNLFLKMNEKIIIVTMGAGEANKIGEYFLVKNK